MVFPGACDKQTNEDNRKTAAGRVGDRCYAPVRVYVAGRDEAKNKVMLTAQQKDGKTVTFTLTWGDEQMMWAPCPSSLPSKATVDAVGAPPDVDTKGDLMLSDLCIDKYGLGATTPKWPKSLGAPESYVAVPIWPTSIRVTGLELLSGNMGEGTVELLDPEFAAPGQTVSFDGNTLEVQLSTLAGVAAFGINLDVVVTSLPAAVEVISSEKKDPRKLAHAWRVVAAADFGARTRGGEVPPAARELLARVLPDAKY